MALSPSAIKVVKSTAAVVAPHAEEITRNFYKRMLGNNRFLFRFFNKNNQKRGEQPKALAHAIVAYASNIDNLGVLGSAVDLMAVKHCGLQVLPEHYPIVHDNLMASVAEVLGDAVTPEIAAGWSEAVMGLAGILIDAEEKLYSEAETRSGGWRGWRDFKVVKKEITADRAATFSFQPDDARAGEKFDFTEGQFLTILSGLKDEEGDEVAPRHYTITSAPGDDVLQATVRKVPGGTVSGWLHNKVKEGDTVKLSPPFGAYRPRAEGPLLFMSAGIGVTPMAAFTPKYKDRVIRAVHVDNEPEDNPFKARMEKELGGVYQYYVGEDKPSAKDVVDVVL
jgi:nitric oxide dioxygenase